uniref:DNA-directed RNA polymerase n=1 Tax=viral metagenome TaxID=1070528 RepID=A0A6C0J4K0_9ZZZZ
MSEYDWNEMTDVVKDIYFSDKAKVVQHQINSYNHFIKDIIPNTVFRHSPIISGKNWSDEQNDYANKIIVEFTKVSMSAPMQCDGPNDPIRPLFPHEARLRNLTYSGQLYVDVKHSFYSGFNTEPEEEIITNIPLCKIPVMLKSDYCNLRITDETTIMNECIMDYGGYFIVNGNEKVIISQERMAENMVFCYEPKKEESVVCEVKSTIDQLYHPVKKNEAMLSFGNKKSDFQDIYTLSVNIPSFKTAIPAFIMFRALGIQSDKEIFNIIMHEDLNKVDNAMMNIVEQSALEMYYQLEDKNVGMTQNDALLYISKNMQYKIDHMVETSGDPLSNEIINQERKLAYVSKNVIDRDFLPHIGTNKYKKALYLGYMIRYLIECHLGKRTYDNRDNVQNKRVDLAGPLLAQIFRTQFLSLVRDIKTDISRVENLSQSLQRTIRSSTIEQKIKFGLSTGNWPSGKNSSIPASKKGIAQVLSRMSYLGFISYLRRVVSPLEPAGNKLNKPRKIYATTTGYICPNETPEGGQVGIVKNLSQSCEVTRPENPAPIQMIMEQSGMVSIDDIDYEDLQNSTYIFINGDLVGFADDTTIATIYENLIISRRHMAISAYISIKWRVEYNELFVYCDGGRYTRPLLIVENNKVLLQERYNEYQYSESWNDLFNNPMSVYLKEQTRYNGAVIEYMDVVELERTLIALNNDYLNKNNDNNYLDYTHCEIDPSLWLGIISGCIPASDHNPSPRNCYQSSMGKQALGIFSTNYNVRMDSNVHVLAYPQKALVSTKTMKYIGIDKIPHGTQVILAICTYGGYNQEDSLSINKTAIQRGLFNSMFFRTYQADVNTTKTHNEESICKPSNLDTKLMSKPEFYKYLENDGIAKIGSVVSGGDVLIGKTVISKSKNNESKKIDASVMMRKTEKGVVDRVIPNEHEPISTNADGNKQVKVRVVDYRVPQLADKFASRHAQKGTVGMIYNEVDMPYTTDGIIPDFIMNPHAIPSRMTVGQILETLLGKAGSIFGKEMDASTFAKIDTQTMFDRLKEYGFEEQCEEVMYNGMTGLQMNSTIYIGPTYYQRLKHMVEDKIHSRISGQVHTTTRQPTEGRSRDGGLRLGEMERDSILAHGATQFIKERFMDASDIFRVYVSKTEQSIVVANPDENIYKYGGKNIPKNDVVEVQLPYAMKLLLHEMTAMGIDTRIIV